MYRFRIENMTCGHCVQTVTKAVQGCDSGASVRVDLKDKSVEVRSAAPEADLRAALARAGYPAQ